MLRKAITAFVGIINKCKFLWVPESLIDEGYYWFIDNILEDIIMPVIVYIDHNGMARARGKAYHVKNLNGMFLMIPWPKKKEKK